MGGLSLLGIIMVDPEILGKILVAMVDPEKQVDQEFPLSLRNRHQLWEHRRLFQERKAVFDGDGMETLELQAKTLVENATRYNGSAPCPTCGMLMNPVEFMNNKGHCLSCLTQSRVARAQGKMV